MRNTHCRTWIFLRKLKNLENETQKLYDLDYGEKTEKTWKMRQKHCMTCNMARNTQKHGKQKMHMLGPRIWREK